MNRYGFQDFITPEPDDTRSSRTRRSTTSVALRLPSTRTKGLRIYKRGSAPQTAEFVSDKQQHLIKTVKMFKLIAFFAILAAAFAAPKPDPVTLTYSAGIPLTYTSGIGAPINYPAITNYNSYLPYASGYNYYSPLRLQEPLLLNGRQMMKRRWTATDSFKQILLFALYLNLLSD
ncbi:hypothetical protein NQ315_001002 [Exocentrus adspersus]|uniref:Uncharacterized protein n=1 Tax=Exocentrus adspersus TaxID=1586481 RepID=A0AAV8WF47_9CUCU|nr:hypothetical protein NQ315_001002 [Exocentrus adspersus]